MTQVRAKTDRVLAIAFRRNVGSRTLLVNECPVLICVIAAICKQHGFRLQPHQCENASNNDPVHDANQLIVTTRQWLLLTGSRFARNVTPPKKQKSIQLQASKQYPGGVMCGRLLRCKGKIRAAKWSGAVMCTAYGRSTWLLALMKSADRLPINFARSMAL